MKNWFVFFLVLCLAAPVWAQLGYQAGTSSSQQGRVEDLPIVVKKTRTSQIMDEPDWYALFLLWAHNHPNDVLQGLRDPKSFDNFTQFLACDWVRDFRQNDVVWPSRQTQIVQKFNEHTLSPQTHFKLVTRGVLGPYLADQQQFVFTPLKNAAYDFIFPNNKLYGMEDDCSQNNQLEPDKPWVREFILAFKNPSLITTLPMDKDRAEFFIENLPHDSKGEIDRHVVVVLGFDVDGFDSGALKSMSPSNNSNTAPPAGVLATVQNAIVYTDANMTKELARYGTFPQTAPDASTAPAPTQPAAAAPAPIPQPAAPPK